MTLHDRGEPRVGSAWRDNTMLGVRPRMEITELDPFRTFGEAGRWFGVRATLTMRFTASHAGCRIAVVGTVVGEGAWSGAARVAGRLAGPAIRRDLVRAGEILTRRPR